MTALDVRGVAGVVVALVAAAAWPAFAGGEALEIGSFSATAGKSLPAGWKPLHFEKVPRHTSYELVRDGGVWVVEARSDASASGLVREIEIDPREYPVVEWRWKIGNTLEKGDLTQKSGDDYPARLYITFAYDASKLSLFGRAQFEAYRLLYGVYPPHAAITYIWDSRAPVGTIAPNVYAGGARMIVVASGMHASGWRSERRNLVEDYRRAFGEDPPGVSGVAIMTDTDDTGESVTSWYGDIVFRTAP